MASRIHHMAFPEGAQDSSSDEGESDCEGCGEQFIVSMPHECRMEASTKSPLSEKIARSLFKHWQKKFRLKRHEAVHHLRKFLRRLILSEDLSHPYKPLVVGEKWQEIQGCNRWAGLLNPLDPVLRAEIIRVGEFAQATYDAFDKEKWSRYNGSCKYKKKELLAEVGLENRGYEITHFLYATAETKVLLPRKDSNWIGFVAVCKSQKEIVRLGRRDIMVAWRGTNTFLEKIMDLKAWSEAWSTPVPWGPNTDVRVASGFLTIYTANNENSPYDSRSARDQVLEAVRELVKKYKPKDTKLSITVTGHSLGSALATLSAYDIAQQTYINDPKRDSASGTSIDGVGNGEKRSGKLFPRNQIPITVYSFAGPRVGNKAFTEKMEEKVAVLRVVNIRDIVTKLPGAVFKLLDHAPITRAFLEKVLPGIPLYSHVGVKLRIDNRKSEYLKNALNPKRIVFLAHNLEVYLHLVDGIFDGNGESPTFKQTMRDLALVNKAGDFLKRDLHIPPSWWQPELHKGLVRNKDWRWELPSRRIPQSHSMEDVQSGASSDSEDDQRSTSSTNYIAVPATHARDTDGHWQLASVREEIIPTRLETGIHQDDDLLLCCVDSDDDNADVHTEVESTEESRPTGPAVARPSIMERISRQFR